MSIYSGGPEAKRRVPTAERYSAAKRSGRVAASRLIARKGDLLHYNNASLAIAPNPWRSWLTSSMPLYYLGATELSQVEVGNTDS